MPEVIMCIIILTRSPFAMSLGGFHGPTLELATVSLITIVVCLCAVIQGTYNANKTGISSCCLSQITKTTYVCIKLVLPSSVATVSHLRPFYATVNQMLFEYYTPGCLTLRVTYLYLLRMRT